MATQDSERKITSDDDWKEQARKEKERLAEKEKQKNSDAATASASAAPPSTQATAGPADGSAKAQSQDAAKAAPKDTPKDKPSESADRTKQPIPPATFLTLVNSLAMQSLYFMGRLGGPEGEQGQVDLDMAKHNIDMLQLLEDKTKGNLTDEESKTLGMALHEIRMQYVQLAQV